MNSNARWMKILAGRVLANALVGGFCFAVVGAFCGAIAGGLFAAFPYTAGYFLIGAVYGSVVGVASGVASGVVGAIIFAVAGFRAEPGELLEPYYDLGKRVHGGQLLGTLLACASFVVFELGYAALQSITVREAVDSTGFYFIFIAPALMICGAIAGTLFKRP